MPLKMSCGTITLATCEVPTTATLDSLRMLMNMEGFRIDRETLVRIPTRLGAAAGAQKADAVLAAIRGQFVTTLVVDEAIASRVLASG